MSDSGQMSTEILHYGHRQRSLLNPRREDLSTKTVEGVWYPSDLSPHMFYINGELSGMAVAIPCLRGESQKWQAFDMRRLNGPNICPVLLGSYEGISLAIGRIEKALGASGIRPC